MKRNHGSVQQSFTARLAQHAAVASSVILVAGLATTGCLDRELRPLVPCVSQGFVAAVAQEAVDKVDLLFMVDNSGSMSEEQASLGSELPRLVRVLTSGDRTGDGLTDDDFAPVKNLHVGVVTNDMGVANFNVPTCTRLPQFGEDGLLLSAGATSITGCMAVYPKFLEYIPGTSAQTPEQFGQDFRCIATLGTGGCGFEQQLEAPLKALTPSTSSITFYGGTRGHGDIENAGFMRPDSVLAIILVTDEEDCSVATGYEQIFDQSGASPYPGDLNIRCFLYPETQWPVRRYIDGFKALRPGRESLVVFGAITGVPVELVQPGTPNYDGILAAPLMQAQIDVSTGAGGARLVPSCNVPGRGIAFPPRRIVQVAQGFGDNGIIQSICQDSFSGALDAIISKIADALGNVCLPRKLNPGDDGKVGCNVVEVIPPPGTFVGQPTSCADLGGVDLDPANIRVNENGSIECQVIQLPTAGNTVPTGAGWYYDNFSTETITSCGADGQRIAFTPTAIPPNGVTVNLECLQRIQGSGGGSGGTIQVGYFCDPSAATDICVGAIGMTLACEPASRTCQVACTTDANCPSSLVCDTSSGSGYCRNPICVD